MTRYFDVMYNVRNSYFNTLILSKSMPVLAHIKTIDRSSASREIFPTRDEHVDFGPRAETYFLS